MFRSRTTWMRSGVAVAIPLLVVLLIAPPAMADKTTPGDPPEKALADRVKDHAEGIKHHKKAGDAEALLKAIDTAVKLFEEAGKPVDDPKEARALEKVRVDLVKMVGSLTSKKNCAEKLTCAALSALGKMGHEKGSRYVATFLYAPKKGRLDRRTMSAIEAAEKIACKSLMPRLLMLVEDSKNLDVAKRAMLALGGFGSLKRCREKILVELTSLMRKYKPGGPSRGHENRVNPGEYIPGKSGGFGARWAALSPALPKTLNRLTGQKIMSAEDWIDLVRANKRKLRVLFEE